MEDEHKKRISGTGVVLTLVIIYVILMTGSSKNHE